MERNLTLYAASGAFYIFMSIIPCVILVSAVLPLSQWNSQELNEAVGLVAPETVAVLLESIINQVYRYSGKIWGLSAVVTLWSASKVIASFMRGIIIASGSSKSTAYIRLTLKAMGYSVLMILAIYLLMLGSVVLNVLSVFHVQLFSHNRMISALVLCLLLALVYRIIPGKSRNYRFGLPGAVLAAAAWMLFNYVYSLWLGVSNRYGVYGTVGSVMVTLLWLYGSMFIIFSGAYMNSFVYSLYKEHGKKKAKAGASPTSLEQTEEQVNEISLR